MTPQLRFPQFTNKWQSEKLGKVFDVRDGTHESPKYIDNGIPLLTSKNLQKDGSLDLSNVSYISQLDFENINRRSKVDVGDILFGMIGTIGNPVRIRSAGFAIKNVALIKEIKIPTKYLIHYLRSPLIEKQFYQKNAGGTQKFIALGDVRLLTIGIPQQSEREKITEFLTTVDERIEKNEKKLELLQKYKRGVLQKIFAQDIQFKDGNGNTYPQWEEKKMGDITNIKTGDSDAQDAVENGEYPFFIRSKEIKRSNKYLYDGEAILIPGEGGIGEIFHYIVGKFNYHQRVYKVSDFKTNVSGKFIFYYLQKNFAKQANVHSVKATVDSLRLPTFTNFLISLPSFEEQQKIADFLTNLDNKINVEKTRLASAKQWKKGLLQKMLV